MAAHSSLTQLRYVQQATGRSMLRQAWTALGAMARARQTRRLLTEMDDHMLADIGIGRSEAMIEASRAPWDLAARH